MMMALGMFVFAMDTAAYQEFQRQIEWRLAENARVGARPTTQFIGPGSDTITLQGTIVPEIAGNALSLELLRLMGDSGNAWPLVEGTGRIYGLFMLQRLDETRTVFFQDGAARKIDFSISLKRVDDSRIDLLGDLVGLGLEILR